MKKYFPLIVLFIILGMGAVYMLDRYIVKAAETRLYSHVKNIPSKNAALLLGTAKYMRGGGKNYFYTYRLRTAIALWKSGKIKAIVVSGDNGTKHYDETTTMFKDLVKAGVPAKYIGKDYAGFRTLDSIVRAEEIFDLNDYIIISQKFHLQRALFIARAKGQKAIGLQAKDLANTTAAYKMKLREYLARTKAFLDVYVLHTQPKFYGKKEKVMYR